MARPVGQRCISGSSLALLPVVTRQTSTSSGLGSSAPPLPWSAGSTAETSGGPDLSDSISSGGVVAQHPHRKVKVNSVLGHLRLGLGPFLGALGCGWAGKRKASSLLVGGVFWVRLSVWPQTAGWEAPALLEHRSCVHLQSRVRVRRASISEPSDTDPEPRTLDPSPAGKSSVAPAALALSPVFRLWPQSSR